MSIIKTPSLPWYNLLLFGAPLLMLPFMLNVRIFPFIAPNEEPKWIVLIVTGLLLLIGAVLRIWHEGWTVRKITIPALLLISYLLLLFISIPVGANVIEGINRGAFWLIAIAIFTSCMYASRTQAVWEDGLAWAIGIAGLSFSLHYWWNYFIDFSKPNYNISVLFSPIGHVNFTGDVLVVLLPAILWQLASRRESSLIVMNWVSAATIGAVLLVAASRGALLGLELGVLIVFVLSIRHAKFLDWHGNSLPIILIASAMLVSFISYYQLPFHFRELARVSGEVDDQNWRTLDKLTENVAQPPLSGLWLLLDSKLTTRTPIFASTTAMIADAPILGQGTGNFPFMYPRYSNKFPDFRDPLSTDRTFTTNPHNMLFQIASQNGVPAMLIFFGLCVLLLLRLMYSLWQRWDGLIAAGVLGIGAVIFDAQFNHVFYNPASMFVFAIFAGLWWGRLPVLEGVTVIKQRLEQLPSPLPAQKATAILLLVLGLMLLIWPARWLASEWQAGHGMMNMRNVVAMEQYYKRSYELDPYNFRAVFGVAQVAYMQRDFKKAQETLEWFRHIYPYNAPALNTLGAVYLMTQQYDKAKEVLTHTLEVLPDYRMAEENLLRVQAMERAQQQRVVPATTTRRVGK
ncbi:MAG: O-antigen ligase family protein [Mariprofundales bacterium]